MSSPKTTIERALLDDGEHLTQMAGNIEREAALAGHETNRLAALEREVADLAAEFGVPAPLPVQASVPADVAPLLDHDLVALRGVLPPEERARIDRLFDATPPAIDPWDSFDYVAVGLAGLVGAAVDALLVRIPASMTYKGEWLQAGSPITEWLREHSMDSDNWLARLVRVPYDRLVGLGPHVTGIHPRSHRLHTLGHDPLFALLFGTLDILRGTATGIGPDGLPFVSSAAETSWVHQMLAPFVAIGHILSDVATRAGVQLPGWALTQLLQVGAPGHDERTLAEVCRFMYLKGYDLRHLATMGLAPASVELLLRGYALLRGVQGEGDLCGALPGTIAAREVERVRGNSKLESLLFWGHAVTAAANAGKVILYHGNPLAINAAQWGAAFTHLFRWITVKTRDRSTERVMGNRARIEAAWEEIEAIPLRLPSGTIVTLDGLDPVVLDR